MDQENNESGTTPQRMLLPPGVPSLEMLVKMVAALTGRAPTAEELHAAQRSLDSIAKKQAALLQREASVDTSIPPQR